MRIFQSFYIAIFIFLLSPQTVSGNEGDDYSVLTIPSALLKNTNVVKRTEDIRCEVFSYTKVRLYRKYALTILNENGDDFANLYVHYDKLTSVKSIEGKLFDWTGKLIKSLKNKDIEDRSNVSGISLMEDNRIKIHNFHHKVYPYTVEYEVVTESNHTYFITPWYPQPTVKYAVEKSTVKMVVPASFGLKYKMFNYPGEPVVTSEKESKIFTWEITGLPSILHEYADPDWALLTTCVFFSSEKFEIGDYKGSMASWRELGNFQLELNKGRDQLPEDVKQKVHQLTDNVKDTKEKVRILYRYLQENTRYISIQLGIGGWQPFDAAYVAKNAYGDCKALTNYMYSLLKEANIKSCYTKINSGRGEYFFMPDFPSNQFNHIILSVPLANDTMWLECTSQTLPAGYLSDFTCNRYALLVDEDGGHLVRTPNYGLKENTQIRKVNAMLDEDATLLIKSNSAYKGLQQDYYHSLINDLSKDKVKELLHEEFDFPTYDIRDFKYKEKRSSLPVIEEDLTIEVSNYATITGKRLFIFPNVMTRTNRKLGHDSTRKYDIFLYTEYEDVDSVIIELPGNYEKESMPKPVEIDTKFGHYTCSVNLADNKLYYYRNFKSFSGRFPAKDYPELVDFYNAIYKADRNRVVLVKRETEKKGF